MADKFEILLKNQVVFRSIYELIEPEDTLNVGSIFKLPCTKIYQSFDLLRDNDILSIVSLITDLTKDEILESDANKMIKFIKWLHRELNKCAQLIASIPRVPDPDLESSGVNELDQFGEFNIYYAITKDPTKWDTIGNLPFELIFTKLKMDGVNAVIQHNYNEIIKRKK